MNRKWPLDLDITPDALRAKAQELLTRDGEWLRSERAALETVRDEAEAVVAIVRATEDAPSDQRGELLRLARAFGTRLGSAEAGAERDDATMEDALSTALEMAGDLLEGIGRADFDDAYRIIPGGHQAFLMEAAEVAQEEAGDAPITLLDAESVLHSRAYAQRGRNLERIERTVQAAISNYGLPERLTPRLSSTDQEREVAIYEWGIGHPLAGEPVLREGHPQRKLIPNGRFEISYASNAVGEMDPRAISRIAAEVQNILLTVGRDIEIDGFGAPLSQPPAPCHAAALPLMQMIRAGTVSSDDIRESAGISTCYGLTLPGDARFEISSDPLLFGTTVSTWEPLAPEVRERLVREADVPLREIVPHEAFDDERIVVRRVEERGDGEKVLFVECPVERIVKLPADAGLEQDPIVAWSDYGSRALVDQFYAGVRERQGIEDNGVPAG